MPDLPPRRRGTDAVRARHARPGIFERYVAMMKTLHDLFVEVTTTAAAVVALTLAGFGFQEATKPTLAWSGSRRERHLIGCPVCRDHSLPAAEQLRRCPRLADLERQLRDRP